MLGWTLTQTLRSHQPEAFHLTTSQHKRTSGLRRTLDWTGHVRSAPGSAVKRIHTCTRCTPQSSGHHRVIPDDFRTLLYAQCDPIYERDEASSCEWMHLLHHMYYSQRARRLHTKPLWSRRHRYDKMVVQECIIYIHEHTHTHTQTNLFQNHPPAVHSITCVLSGTSHVLPHTHSNGNSQHGRRRARVEVFNDWADGGARVAGSKWGGGRDWGWAIVYTSHEPRATSILRHALPFRVPFKTGGDGLLLVASPPGQHEHRSNSSPTDMQSAHSSCMTCVLVCVCVVCMVYLSGFVFMHIHI